MDSLRKQRKKHHLFSSLLCFSFFALFFIFFHPPQLPIHRDRLIRIDDRVVFPDHILVLVLSKYVVGINGFKCSYTDSSGGVREEVRGVLSVDEYDDIRWLVRCPLPPTNFSSAVTLRSHTNTLISFEGSLKSWENLAYEALLDAHTNNTLLLFVKGISHRQNKQSDPNRFSCHFGLKSIDKYMLITSTALTAAQEVVRCVLPATLPEGIHVTVSFQSPRGHRVMVPSVAKISTSRLKSNKTTKHELCVCTMLWNQAGSIREWITYHSWLGVERWFIYDNNSDDEIEEVIEKLNLEGGFNVSRHVWPWIKTQEAGFSHCAIRARDECNWVSFMDVDEFYYFPRIMTRASLKSLVSNYTSSSIGELRTSCHSFGPSGLTSSPKQGVTVGYTCRLRSPERHKSIIRPDAMDTSLMNVVHHFHLKKGFGSKNVLRSSAVINHYKYQVWEAFRAKFSRRVATYVADWQDNHNEGSKDRAPGLGTEPIEPSDWRLRFCEVRDTGLRKFVLTKLADAYTGALPWDT